MRLELTSTAKGMGLRMVPESPEETEQLRSLRSLGVEAKVMSVEFAVPRRRSPSLPKEPGVPTVMAG